jgi:methylmalonyl-CoA mutase N-terminal domain/subunit
MGGAVAAIEEGWMQGQIEESAYREAKRQASGESVVVGVNRFNTGEHQPVPVLEIDPMLEEGQKQRLATWRENRDQGRLGLALAAIEDTARSEDNLLHPMKVALASGATVGEVSDVLRKVFGEHRPSG